MRIMTVKRIERMLTKAKKMIRVVPRKEDHIYYSYIGEVIALEKVLGIYEGKPKRLKRK
ncbi:hypothetical protein IIA15_00980 [candidate division TA06 bacterium]|nr:hypothetical protein [candidate division TA06 bacterium]